MDRAVGDRGARRGDEVWAIGPRRASASGRIWHHRAIARAESPMIWLMPWDADHPARHPPWATWSLMALNVLVFLGVMTAAYPAAYDRVFMNYGLVPSEVQAHQFLTANFLHAGWMHLIGNMLFLFVFGDNVEDVLGPGGMLLLYFGGGFLGDLLFVGANPLLAIPSVGASGCIAALAGAYAVMFFRHRVGVRIMLLVFPIYTFYLHALWVLLVWFGMDLYLTLDSKGRMDAGGVNFVAHGVGFATGVAVGVLARLHGALRRFDRLPRGHAWFGYWPSTLEDRRTRRTRG
jgi:membrane associated rhomboid family serine protease